MRRGSLAGLVAVTAVIVVVAGACGSGDDQAASTLPPIATTSTTTTVFETTTTVQQYYEVQPGDTLFAIAERFHVDIADLMTLNGIADPDHIEAGQELEIPRPKAVTDTFPPTTSTPTTV